MVHLSFSTGVGRTEGHDDQGVEHGYMYSRTTYAVCQGTFSCGSISTALAALPSRAFTSPGSGPERNLVGRTIESNRLPSVSVNDSAHAMSR